ncbi:hypothetical protein N2152v2_006930 [Parachlorella kessleri]
MSKTPKQVLLEFYALYPDAQKPSFAVVDAPGSVPTNPQFKATVVCPQVQRSPGDVAFEDMVFEGMGRNKKAAEHDCAQKAMEYIRSLPNLKFPSTILDTTMTLAAPMSQQPAAAPPQLHAGVQPTIFAMPVTTAATAPAFSPAAAAVAAGAAVRPGPTQLGLTINDAAIENMAPDQLKVLGLYKNLVQAVHAENQRHSTELDNILLRQL